MAAKKSQPAASSGQGLMTVEALQEIRKDLAKDLGVDLLWGDNDEYKLVWLPTGIPAFDKAMGGGVPFNRMALIIGDFSAGKTTFVHLLIKAAQERNLSVAYVDAERAWNPDWATSLGVDISKMLISRPVTGEKAFDTALALVRRKIALIVIDSLAALTPDAMLVNEEEGELFEGKFMGRSAQLNNRGIQSLINENQGSIILIINQLREKVGVSYGSPETLPGGKAQTFYDSQNIRVRRGAWIEEGTGKDKKRVGYKMRIRMEKSKVGRPYEEGEASFYFTTGSFDEIASMVDLAVEAGLFEGTPPRYNLSRVDTETGEVTEYSFYGKGKLLDGIRADQVLQDYLRELIDTIPEEDV